MANEYQTKRHFNEIALYVFARCEQFVEDYARSAQISAHELAGRVGELFYAQTRGSVLGAEDSMSTLPGSSSRNGAAASALAVASGARGRTQKGIKPGYSYGGTHWTQQPKNRAKLLRTARKNVKRAQIARWPKQKKHWMQLPENRARVVKHTQKMAKARTGNRKSTKLYSTSMRSYWTKMTPEERSREILRRQQVTRAKQKEGG